jgi:hypothetical protein
MGAKTVERAKVVTILSDVFHSATARFPNPFSV